jgi:hypothetical protein
LQHGADREQSLTHIGGISSNTTLTVSDSARRAATLESSIRLW